VKLPVVGIVGLVLGTAGMAAAQGVAPAKEPDGSSPPPATSEPAPAAPPASTGPVTYSHKGQIQASLRLSLGMRAIVAYDDADYCGETDSMSSTGNKAVCTGRTPFSFDLELGYGIARKIDLIGEFRFSLETDFNSSAISADDAPHVFHFSPGIRFFFSDAKTMKLFTTAQVVFDFSGYKDAAGQDRGADFGVRNMNGLWLDLDRAYGFYAYAAETATFGRWLLTELELGVGVSARFR
jgi:hypothetical protein